MTALPAFSPYKSLQSPLAYSDARLGPQAGGGNESADQRTAGPLYKQWSYKLYRAWGLGNKNGDFFKLQLAGL